MKMQNLLLLLILMDRENLTFYVKPEDIYIDVAEDVEISFDT